MKGEASHLKNGRGGGAGLFRGDTEGSGGGHPVTERAPHPVGGSGNTEADSVPHASKAATQAGTRSGGDVRGRGASSRKTANPKLGVHLNVN